MSNTVYHDRPDDSKWAGTGANQTRPTSGNTPFDRADPASSIPQIDLLESMGFSFVLVGAGDKRPVKAAWQTFSETPDAAQAHVLAGGNLGVHLGKLSGGMVAVDVDKGLAHVLDSIPELAGTLQSYRDNATDRRKFFLRIDGDLPLATSYKTDLVQIDLLSSTKKGTDKQAVVLGTHPSGAQYRLSGDALLTVDGATFAGWWQRLTGKNLTSENCNSSHEQSTAKQDVDPDSLIGKVKAAWQILDVFAHFGLAAQGTRQEPDGQTRVLDNGGLIVSADGELWFNHSAQMGGNLFNAWQYGQTGGQTADIADGEFWPILREMADLKGIEYETGWRTRDPEEVQEDMRRRRTWLHHADGTEALRDIGFVRVEGPRKTFDALLARCEEHGTDKVCVGLRRIGEWTNQNHQTVRNHLELFAGAGWVVVDTDHSPWLLTIAPVPYLDTFSNSTAKEVSNYGTGREFYGDNRADDAFLINHAAYKKRRAAADLPALPSLGQSSLLVLSHLVAYGDRDRAQLRHATGLGEQAVGKATRRLEEYGIVEVVSERSRGAKVYDLADGWKARIEELRPYLVTDGTQDRRIHDNAYNRVAWAHAQKDVDPAYVARVESQLDALEGMPVAQWVGPPWFGPEQPVSKETLDERRVKAYEAMMERANGYLQRPLLWQAELADLRYVMGRLGENLADYVQNVNLDDWGMAA